MKFNKNDVIETVEDLRYSTHDNWLDDKVYVKLGPNKYYQLARIEKNSTALIYALVGEFKEIEDPLELR